MKFDLCPEMQEKVVAALRDRRTDFDTKKIHVSYLTKCLKRAFFKMKGFEPEFEEERLLRFTIGRSHHEILQNLDAKEFHIEKYGVTANIDMLTDIPEGETIVSYPVEIKSTRMRLTERAKIPDHYIEQLGYYCVLKDVKIGYLVILWVIQPQITVWRVEFDDKEFLELLEDMMDRRDLLVEAVEKNDSSKLENTNYEWECKFCEYLKICKFGKSEEISASFGQPIM